MRKTGLFLATAAAILSMSMTSFAASWEQDSNGWWYTHDDGSYAASGWENINGQWYYFNPSGYLLENQWIDGLYYVGSDGAMLVNTTTPDGYHVGADGAWDQQSSSSAVDFHWTSEDQAMWTQMVAMSNYFIGNFGTFERQLQNTQARQSLAEKILFIYYSLNTPAHDYSYDPYRAKIPKKAVERYALEQFGIDLDSYFTESELSGCEKTADYYLTTGGDFGAEYPKADIYSVTENDNSVVVTGLAYTLSDDGEIYGKNAFSLTLVPNQDWQYSQFCIESLIFAPLS